MNTGRVVPESDIRDIVLEYLQRRNVFVWRDKQSIARGKRGIHFPESNGCPDIIGITKSGRFLGIEIKKPTGVLSIKQHEFLNRIKENGGVALVVTELGDIISNWKLIGGVDAKEVSNA